MTFVKTLWNDDALPDMTAAQLNRQEQGIADAHSGVAIPAVFALPANPVEGQQVYYVADQTNGVVWHLRYRALQQNGAANPSPYKWECLGGGQLYHEVGTEEQTALAAFVDLATVGPQVTCPLAGDYIFGGFMDVYATQADGAPYAALKIGAAAVTGGERLILERTGAGGVGSFRGGIGGRPIKRTVAAANTVCKIQYGSGNNNGTVTFGNRVLVAVPVRVG